MFVNILSHKSVLKFQQKNTIFISNNPLFIHHYEFPQQHGISSSLVKGVVSMLQYAHDTILFMERELLDGNMKLILCIFKQLFGLINCHKIDIFLWKENDEEQQCKNFFWVWIMFAFF
jgi:hypothetical protein